MKFLSRWLKSDTVAGRNYESLLWLESETLPGVEFSLRKISLAQRIELSSRVRELTLRNEFLRSGEPRDQLEACIADLLVQKLYVQWAVVDLKGLRIDGQQATVELLLERGPEALVQEMVDAIHSHLELSDAERKNF
jgi:hypothetical protein